MSCQKFDWTYFQLTQLESEQNKIYETKRVHLFHSWHTLNWRMCLLVFRHCRIALPTSKTLKPVTPGYPAPPSWLLGTTSIARVVGAGRELIYLVVRQEQQIPSIRICACARKDQVAQNVLDDALLGGQWTQYHLFTANAIWHRHSAINYIGFWLWCGHRAAYIRCWPSLLAA